MQVGESYLREQLRLLCLDEAKVLESLHTILGMKNLCEHLLTVATTPEQTALTTTQLGALIGAKVEEPKPLEGK